MKKGQNVKTAWVNSPQADAVAEYYVQGHTVRSTAAKYGVSTAQVNNLVKKRGLTNGEKWGVQSEAQKEHIRAAAEQRLVAELDAKGFDYIGGYTRKTGNVAIRCRACGEVYDRTVAHIKNGNLICRKCEHEKALIRQEERREAKLAETERRRTEAERRRAEREPKDYYKERHEAFLDRAGICEICGKPYTVREYVESCGLKQARDNGVCSDRCRRIKNNREGRESRKRRGVNDSHRHRAHKYGCAYDSSITLEKLIKRDGLRCAICGKMCSTSDHRWSKYSGPTYPSIDHILPMSKGGGHTWDNVQIAHIICNSYKGDLMGEATA